MAAFLLRLLEQYQQPIFRVQSSAQTSFENSEREQKFLKLKLHFRAQLQSVFRLLHESHLVFCKLVLEQVKRA